MSRFERIGLIGLVFFAVLWSLFLILRYLTGELRIEDLGSWVLILTLFSTLFILGFRSYRVWMRERSRRVERMFLETPAIYGWHPIVLFLLIFVVAASSYALGLEPTMMMWISYSLWVSLLLLLIAVMARGKISIDAEGLWTSRGYFSWEDFKDAKLNGRLLNLGGEGNVYIVLKPSEFMKAVETFKPKASDCEE